MLIISEAEKKDVSEIVEIHLKAFEGFFLSFLGRGFLKYLYQHFIIHESSSLLIAKEKNQILGFLAYSESLSDFYKTLLISRFFVLGWYSFMGVCRNPKIIFKLLKALNYSKKAKSDEKYLKLSSIGVLPDIKKGVGSMLINKLKENAKKKFRAKGYRYIYLETDSENNEIANKFYQKNNFILYETYFTSEKRKMNIYRYSIIGEV